MKNTLYGIFDRITMLISPLVENLFDRAEVLIARRTARRGKRRLETAFATTALRDARATSTRRREPFGW